jgi:hypothetical protein
MGGRGREPLDDPTDCGFVRLALGLVLWESRHRVHNGSLGGSRPRWPFSEVCPIGALGCASFEVA